MRDVEDIYFMNTVQQMMNGKSSTDSKGCLAHLMITESHQIPVPEEWERVIREIQARATEVGPVLEGILHEPEGIQRWGLNE
jgi:hypothetical protein